MADVVLSAGVRQNLLSLQSTAHLMSVTQNRLATGKKVNTALDNPANYFSSQALSNRAGDLNATSYEFDIAINGGAALHVSYLSDGSATEGEIVTGLTDAFNAAIATQGYSSSDIVLAQGSGGQDLFTLDAVNADIDFVVSNTAASGVTNGTYASTSLLDRITTAGGTAGTSTLVANINGGATTTITFGTGPGQISTKAELNAALGNITGLTASVGGSVTSFVVGASSIQNNLTLTSSTGVNTALGIGANINQNGALVSTVGSDATRASLQNDFNEVITQIDALSKDTSYNGINLLYGDNLKVVFNEKGTSNLIITGVVFDSAGLGVAAITGNGFQADATIDTTITNLDGALGKLRNQASKFGSNLNTVQARQDFTKGLIATLETGADNLVLADTNEEGANMLALQTRQSLSTTALSLSAQADQAVLRLFG